MKRTIKKWAVLLLAVSMTVGFAACSKAPEDGSSLLSSSEAPVSSRISAEDYDYSASLTEEGYFDGVKALDHVALPDYRGMELPSNVTDITDNAVQQEVDSILAPYAEETKKEGFELTDEFVAEKLKDSKGWSSVGEMKTGIRAELLEKASREYLWQQVQEQSKVKEIPQEVSDYYANNLCNYYVSLAEQSNMELEDILSQQVGVNSLEELKEKNKEQLEVNAKTGLILQALCEEMEIHPTESDLKEYFQSQTGSDDYSKLEESYGKPYLYMMVREYLAKEKLTEKAAD